MTLIPVELRQDVFDRAGGICEYCGLPQATQVATFPVDHVVPIAAGGETQSGNLALAYSHASLEQLSHRRLIKKKLVGTLIP